MKILMSGSHGLVGSALTKSFLADNDQLIPLVRYTPQYGSEEIEWSPERYSIALARLEGFDAVIHLAGESIAGGRWTDERKKRIRESRIKGTQLLSEALANLKHPPQTFLCASAIGYYGSRGNEVLSERSTPGNDFLASVCIDWERATAEAAEKGIRVINLRFGIILDAKGGALAQMLPPFRMGVGGKIGNGKQWMSWVTLDDVVAVIKFLLVNQKLKGPVNVVSPGSVTNAEFSRTLGHVLSRPTFFPIPAFGVRIMFGEMADALLLSSQRVGPVLLLEAGYQFQYPQLAPALSHLLKT